MPVVDRPTFRRESVLSDFNAGDYPRRSHTKVTKVPFMQALASPSVALVTSRLGARGCYSYKEGFAALLAIIVLLIRDTVDILQGIAPAKPCEPNLPQYTRCIQPLAMP